MDRLLHRAALQVLYDSPYDEYRSAQIRPQYGFGVSVILQQMLLVHQVPSDTQR